MSGIIGRIRKIIDYNGLNDKSFANKIGMPYSTFAGLMLKEREVKASTLQLILKAFPQISPSWLLMDIGDMLQMTVEDANEYQATHSPLPIVPPETIRIVELDTMDWMEKNDVRAVSINQLISTSDALIEMASDVMSPVIEKGDMLAFRRLPDNGCIVDGECYVLDTSSRGIIIRNIYTSDNDFIGRSINRHYAPLSIKRKDILAIFQIVGLIRTHISTSDNLADEQMTKMMENFSEVVKQNSKMVDFITRTNKAD